MAERRIDATYEFTKRHARAKIICRECGHFSLVSGPVLDLMFPKPMPVSWAEKRLRCTKCYTRGKARIEAIMPLGR
jgi:hypothetical protein